MALNNFQYDTIMREYQQKQIHHRHELNERVAQALSRFPRLKEIDDLVASKSVACGKQMLSGNTKALSELKEEIARLGNERRLILEQAGYPADYLEMHYTCPDCKDTGYVNNQKCRCFRKAAIDLLYTQSNLHDILERENFSVLSYEYYPSDPVDSAGKSPLDRFKQAVQAANNFIDTFDTQFQNLFLFGDTGMGKTFLSHCVAKELLDTTHSVIYFSAQQLFERLADERFRRDADTPHTSSLIYECDLLIIDDLGTEMTNSLVNSELFNCLNDRLNNRRSTIISTNLSLEHFAGTYSERVLSRIMNQYTMIKLVGKDIRLQKRLQAIQSSPASV